MWYLYSRGPVRQVLSKCASDELDLSYKKMADNLNYYSDVEELEWLTIIDPSLTVLDKSNEKSS